MVNEPDAKAQEDRCVLPKPSLSRTITPGYMAAVMSSPEVLCNLCHQYFRQYDKNKNGLMECHEALELAKDLGSTLAVPLGSTEEVLRPSLKRFSEEGRDALNLEEFCRWFPTVLGLEPLSPQHIEEIKSCSKEGYEAEQTSGLAPPSLNRSLSPGYVTALASSPQTMQTFCKQLFRQYNVNEHGIPQCADAERVASDLFLKLGVSPDESMKGRLKECLSQAHLQVSLEALVERLSELLFQPSQPDREKTTNGYVHAVKSSPRTFVQLCRKYFREYDFNQNSFLDDAELLALARDLSERLNVPLKSSSELRESMGQFSDNGSACLSLSEFIPWFGTMIGLEEPMMKEIRQMASQEL